MKFGLIGGTLLAAMATVVPVASVRATEFVDISVMGRVLSSDPWSSTLNVGAGTAINFELVAKFNLTSGISNSNTGKKPNGTTDAITSLPYFSIGDGNGTFSTSVLQSGFDGGTGASNGSVAYPSSNKNGSVANMTLLSDIRAVASSSVNADSAITILTGTLVTGSSTTSVTAGTETSTSAAPVQANQGGSLKIAGTVVSASDLANGNGSEQGNDPLIKYTPLSIAASNPLITLKSGSIPAGYGSSTLGSTTVPGNHASGYQPGPTISLAAATNKGAVEVKGIDSRDDEYFGLNLVGVTSSGSTSLSQIISTINTSGVGVTASDIAHSQFANFSPFSADNLLLKANFLSADQFLGFDFSSLNGISVSEIDAVPEPASLGLLGLGAMAMLRRRRTVKAKAAAV